MSLLRESYLYHLWATFYALYLDGAVHRGLMAAGDWFCRQIDESRVLTALRKEGALAGSWKESRCCRLLSWLLNLPGTLVHWISRKFPSATEGSFFVRLAARMGEGSVGAEAVLILLLWSIPFAYWNNAYSLLAFLLVLSLLYLRRFRQGGQRLDVENLGFYPMLVFGAAILAVVFSYSPSGSLRFLIYHLSAALCVLVTVSVVRTSRDLKHLAAGAGGAVLCASLYGVYQRIQGVEVNELYVDVRLNEGMPGRVMSFFDNPNTFAEVLILLLPLVLALVLCSKSLWGKLLSSAVFLLGAAALGMTYSRASWMGMAVAMVILVFLWKPRLIPVFVLLCVALLPFLPDTIWNRLLTILNPADTSTASRVPLMSAAVEVIQRSPITGAGLGTEVTQKYISDWNLYHGGAPYVHSHNLYLELWIEMGLLGLVGFLSSMLWNIKRAAAAVRNCGDSAARTITCTAAAALCGAMVCGLADYLWNYPRVMCIFWFVFAMALAGVKLCHQEAKESQTV